MKRVFWTSAALAILLGCGSGCATWGGRQGLAVNVVNVVPTQASLFETTAALTLRLLNESTEAVDFIGSTHRLYLNGTYVGRAVTSEKVTLAALATTTQTVTVFLENLTLVRKFSQLQQEAVIDYRLESEFLPATGGRFGAWRTTATGEVDLTSFQASGRRGAPATR